MAPDKRTPSLKQPDIERGSIDPDGGVYLAADTDRARDAIVRSYRIIKVSDYFLDEWLPLLGPSRWLAALSFRQVAFVHKCKDKSGHQPTRTTFRQLAKWAGQSRPQMHKLLKVPNLLTWFVQPEEGVLGEHPGSRSERRTYLVRIEIPLTPADQAKLQAFLKANQPSDDEGWLQTLHDAISAKKEKAPPNSALPKRPKSIQQMVRELRDPVQPLSENIDWACDELLERWQTQNFGQVTHYFMKRWMPDLTPGLGCLMIWSRRHANRRPELQIGQLPNTAWRQLAAAVGVSSKSVRRWFSEQERYPHTLSFMQPIPIYSGSGELRHLDEGLVELGREQLSLGTNTLIKHDLRAGDIVQATAERRDGSFHAHLLQLADERDHANGFQQTGLRFDVKLTEPIHPDDQPYYRLLLKNPSGSRGEHAVLRANVQRPGPGQDSSTETNKRLGTEVDKPQTNVEIAQQPAPPAGTKVDMPDPVVDSLLSNVSLAQPEIDTGDPAVDITGTDVDALRGLLRDSQDSVQFFKQEQLQPLHKHTEAEAHIADSNPSVVVAQAKQWDIEHILTQAGIPKRDKKAILARWETHWQQFVGWLLWSLATESIEAPVVHALSRVKGNESPPDDYFELGAVALSTLEGWIRADGFDCPSTFRKPVRELHSNDALSGLSRLGCVSSAEMDDGPFWDATAIGDSDQSVTRRSARWVDEPLGDHGMMASEVWHSVKAQLQIELPRTVFDNWLRDVQLERLEEDTLVLGVANAYAREWLKDRASITASQVLTGIVGRPMQVEFRVLG